jgi:hypothetical protein
MCCFALIFAGFTVNDSVKLQFLNYHETSGEPREPARTEDTTAELDAARVCLFFCLFVCLLIGGGGDDV